jgi:hypothetical protein
MKTKLTALLLAAALTLAGCANEPAQEQNPETPQQEQKTEITPEETPEPPPNTDYLFEYEIIDSSDTAFEASVRIINMTRTAVDGWKLFFNGDFTITETQNAKLIDSGAGHIVINEFWTRAINPHSSAIFTFTAEKPSGAEIALDGFILSENDFPDEIPEPVTLPEPEEVPENEETQDLRNDERELRIGYQGGDSFRHVSKDLILPSEGQNGSIISWFSSNENIINNYGEIVNRPTGGFFPMTLTAVIENGEHTLHKIFDINVAPLNNVIQEEMTWEDLTELNDNVKPVFSYDHEGRTMQARATWVLYPIYSIEDAFSLMAGLSEVLGMNEPNSELRINERSNINQFVFTQYYKGLRVSNTNTNININEDTREANLIMSSYAKIIDIDIIPKISIEEAKQVIITKRGINEIGEYELFIRYNHATGEAELAWNIYVDFTFPSEIWVSAVTGEIIYIEEAWMSSGATTSH